MLINQAQITQTWIAQIQMNGEMCSYSSLEYSDNHISSSCSGSYNNNDDQSNATPNQNYKPKVIYSNLGALPCPGQLRHPQMNLLPRQVKIKVPLLVLAVQL